MHVELIVNFSAAAAAKGIRASVRRSSALMMSYCAVSSGGILNGSVPRAVRCRAGLDGFFSPGPIGRRSCATAAFAAAFCAATKVFRLFSSLALVVNRDHDMLQFRNIASAALLAAAFTNPVAAQPTGATELSQAQDCNIEPFIVTELGSPANGLLEEILADRGQRVTKGMVVARLRSDLEQASLDLAKARAEATALIELA